MKITTKTIRRPPSPPSATPGAFDLGVRLPFSEDQIDLEPPEGHPYLGEALPPIYDPFTDSLVLTFVWLKVPRRVA